MPIDLPIEIQLQVFRYLDSNQCSTLSAVVRLSKLHNRLTTPLLYNHISTRDPVALTSLVRTLEHRPDLARQVRSFFFRGPQSRRVTGEDALTLLADDGRSTVDGDDEDEDEALQVSKLQLEEINEMRRLGLEPGIDGEGQETTFDVHESVMLLCTAILRICAPTLQSIGFVDCVPWFLAPAEGGTLNFPLPSCKDFTGVTVGLFGLLPHLQKNGQWNENGTTSLERVHLIGGDFGSFALQRALIASPSAQTITDLHITAPSLYRAEHHEHLIAHVQNLIDHLPGLKRITVAIIRWHPPPPLRKSTGPVARGHQHVSRDDDRLTQCRQAYMHVLPEALKRSWRDDVRVGIIRLPFAQGSPSGFAGWVMKHHSPNLDCDGTSTIPKNDTYRRVWLHLWNRRDLDQLPMDLSPDGTPRAHVWDLRPTIEWTKNTQGEVELAKGKNVEW